MDVTELLRSKPVLGDNKSRDDALPEIVNSKVDHSDVIDSIEEDVKNDIDASEIRKIILTFEKRSLHNQDMRIKFGDEPPKFMESEVELFDSIQKLRSIATLPEFYSAIVTLKTIKSLIDLMSHENLDIVLAVIELFNELTEPDVVEEVDEDTIDSLINSFSENAIMQILVECLERFTTSTEDKKDTADEKDGIYNCLSIIENVVELNSDLVLSSASKCGLLAYLKKRLRTKTPFEQNKLFCSEILSLLLHGDNGRENCRAYGELSSSMDLILQQLAFYKRRDPSTPEEKEMVENIFNCLCYLIGEKRNRELFLKGEGVELMNLLLREKRFARPPALKILDHALLGVNGRKSCIKFIEILGLRSIFSLFMRNPKRSKRYAMSIEEIEEHVVSIIASLFKNLRPSKSESAESDSKSAIITECHRRLMSKFTESKYEKVERLMELHFKYSDKLDQFQSSDMKNIDGDEDEIYLDKLNNGLFTLQLVDYIILETCSHTPEIKSLVMKILGQRKCNVSVIRNVIRQYADSIEEHDVEEENLEQSNGDMNNSANNTSEASYEKDYLKQMVDRF